MEVARQTANGIDRPAGEREVTAAENGARSSAPTTPANGHGGDAAIGHDSAAGAVGEDVRVSRTATEPRSGKAERRKVTAERMKAAKKAAKAERKKARKKAKKTAADKERKKAAKAERKKARKKAERAEREAAEKSAKRAAAEEHTKTAGTASDAERGPVERATALVEPNGAGRYLGSLSNVSLSHILPIFYTS
jgi:hypothetical protein